MASRGRRHILVVEIDCLDVQGSHAAEERLLRWVEHFGHTAPSFGFEFFSVGRIAGEPMKDRVKADAADNKE